MRYRAKPVELESVQWTGENFEEVRRFAGDDVRVNPRNPNELFVHTNEGGNDCRNGILHRP